MPKSLSTIWPNIAGATLLAILKARNQNADPNYPPKVNAEEIYNEICNNILSIALAERKKADIRAKTLEIRYQYTPKEDACPIAKWKKDPWKKIGAKSLKITKGKCPPSSQNSRIHPSFPFRPTPIQTTSTEETPTESYKWTQTKTKTLSNNPRLCSSP